MKLNPVRNEKKVFFKGEMRRNNLVLMTRKIGFTTMKKSGEYPQQINVEND